MRRKLTIALAPLLALTLGALVLASDPAPARARIAGTEQLADDGGCKRWCCKRICYGKNQCTQYCWCCG